MQPLTPKEVKKVCEYTIAIVRRLGLSASFNYSVVFLSPGDLERISKGETVVEVEDGVYVDPRGLIIVRSDLLANIAVRKVMVGILSLASIENFGEISMSLVNKLVNEYYDKILVYLYR